MHVLSELGWKLLGMVLSPGFFIMIAAAVVFATMVVVLGGVTVIAVALTRYVTRLTRRPAPRRTTVHLPGSSALAWADPASTVTDKLIAPPCASDQHEQCASPWCICTCH